MSEQDCLTANKVFLCVDYRSEISRDGGIKPSDGDPEEEVGPLQSPPKEDYSADFWLDVITM